MGARFKGLGGRLGWMFGGLGLLAPAAEAHERPSFATSISVAGSRVAIQTTFGLVLGDGSDPQPGSWRWICPGAMGTIPTEDPPTFFLGPHTLLMPGFDGLTVGTEDACQWRPAADGLSQIQVFDGVAVNAQTAYAVTSSGQQPNAVHRTTDGGRTWSVTSDPLTGATRFDSVRVAPSDARRLYVGASLLPRKPGEDKRGVIYRSEDAGATWEVTELAMDPAERSFQLMAVDPTDPDVLLARFSSPFADRVVRSSDGGISFSTVLNSASAEAVAWHPDGQPLVLSGSAGAGVFHSMDGGETFEVVNPDLALGCFAYVGDALWACGGESAETAVSRSFDHGETFEPVLVFETDIPVEITCPAGTTVASQCVAAVDELREDFGLPPLAPNEPDAGVGGRPDGGVRLSDAGARDGGGFGGVPDFGSGGLSGGGSVGSSGSGCTAGPTGAIGGLWAWLGLGWAFRRGWGRRADAVEMTAFSSRGAQAARRSACGPRRTPRRALRPSSKIPSESRETPG
jgi:hypothetical protein